MIVEALQWLLDLEHIRIGRDAPLLLNWDARIPAWMLFGFGLCALAAVFLIYRREQGSVARRVTLGVIRCALIALVAAVICRPSLVLQQNRVDKAHVALLIDNSLSMSAPDGYGESPELAGVIARGAALTSDDQLAAHSRLELLQAALTRDDAAALHRLLEQNALQLSTFSDNLELRGFAAAPDAVTSVAEAVAGLAAEGPGTDIARAITAVIDKAQGRRIAAIVVASDGQSTTPSSLKDALDVARGKQIPIYAIPIGSPIRPRDVEVASLRAQEIAFINDVLPIEARILAPGADEPVAVTVNLVEDRSGTVLDTREIIVEPGASPTIELHARPTQAELARYRVESVALAGERTLENNAEVIDVRIVEDRIRVLFVDAYPRYEYRYLKNALLREATVELSVLLLDADEQFVQEGTFPIRRFPESAEELNRFDVVLFGDVDPRGGWLSESQMAMLLDFVGNDGGGFGLVAGERAAPQRFVGTPLEKLIPVRIDPQFVGGDGTANSGFQMQITPEGRRSRLFRSAPVAAGAVDQPATAADEYAGLPDLYWFARSLGATPGATVLAEHPTVSVVGDTGSALAPLVVVGRYGAGRIFFQATDDTWRWRRHTGELLHDTYWVQVTRELMRAARVAQDRRIVVRTDRRIYDYGSTVQVQIEVLDGELLAAHPESLTVAVSERQADAPASAAAVMTRIKAVRLGPESRLYEGSFTPPHAGSFRAGLEGIAARPGEAPAAASFRVERPDVESRNPQADHETLTRLADATDGRVVPLDQLVEGLGAIRDRSVMIPDDVTEPLWDSRLVLMLFVLLIGMEWILRKAFGML